MIQVHTEGVSYPVHIGPGLLAGLHKRISSLTRGRVIVVTSPEIWSRWGRPLLSSLPQLSPRRDILFLPSGEQSKRLAQVEKLAEQLVLAGADRDTLLVALGGGVVGDVTGFLAAIYMRGIRYIQLPTTLLAQVDSSVGGKTGVNLRAGKNLLGSFHHPLAVFADTDFLGTLPHREFRSGLFESLKAGIIRDTRLFRFMEQNAAAILRRDPSAITRVVSASVRVKAAVVAADERESMATTPGGTSRMILNFGHTVGHAIEAAGRYRAALHGEAVAWGMIAATLLAGNRGTLAAATSQCIHRAIFSYGPLPRLPFQASRLLALTARDKKSRGGHLRFVLASALGKADVVSDVTEDELKQAISGMLELAQKQ